MFSIKYLCFFIIITIFAFSEECTYESNDCEYKVDLQNFNENILTYYFTSFSNQEQSLLDVFSFQIVTTGQNCNIPLKANYAIQIFSPEVRIENFEHFYNAELEINVEEGFQYFTNADFAIDPRLNSIVSNYDEALIEYISQSGKLPNGQYRFIISIDFDNQQKTCVFNNLKEINRPIALELISPGSIFSDMETTTSIIYNTNPQFLWHSDYCNECKYAIRIAEYDHEIYNSPQEALFENLILPNDKRYKFYDLPSNSNSFQSSIDGLLNFEIGKYYVWQIKRYYQTTLDERADYSPIFIFQIRSSTKKQIDFSDPYLSLIHDIIGNDDFNLLFGTGGELDRFVTEGESVWINDKEVHIDILFLLVDKLKKGEIKIESYEIK